MSPKDLSEKWLKENDPLYSFQNKKRKRTIEYPYLSSVQEWRRKKKEMEYFEEYQYNK